MLVSISQKRAWQPLNYFTYMKSKYFKEYFCSFSSKSYYFYILSVSHLNDFQNSTSLLVILKIIPGGDHARPAWMSPTGPLESAINGDRMDTPC